MHPFRRLSFNARGTLVGAPRIETSERRRWYRIAAAASPAVADVHIYGPIGHWSDGISAQRFVADLAKLAASVKTIRLHVNSTGGDVFEAIAIANALAQHRARVHTTIEGLAASAASIITSAASDTIEIYENAMVMVHLPWTVVLGNRNYLRETADILEKHEGAIIASYQRFSKLSSAQLLKLMSEETWMDAAEAVANGFASKVISNPNPKPKKAAARAPKPAASATPAIDYAALYRDLNAPKPRPNPKAGSARPALEGSSFADLAASYYAGQPAGPGHGLGELIPTSPRGGTR